MKKIRYYINTHKHPLVDVELTGVVEVHPRMWDLMDDRSRKDYIQSKFFEKVQWSFEEVE